jgi:hypothetical protein
MPKLHDAHRVQRRRARGQNCYVYFSANDERYIEQKELRFPPLKARVSQAEKLIEKRSQNAELARREIELTIAVLSSFLLQEAPTEKSICDALRKQGYQLNQKTVREIFLKNKLSSKKNY